MHIVYRITFKSTGKSYIGYTGKGILERMHKHMTNACSGIDSHFYKALRLYGISDCIFETLFSSDDKSEALNKEAELIEKFNTIKNGYNIATGGSGGWSVPDSKYKKWSNQIVNRTNGENNPNFSGVSNQEILDHAESFYIKNKKFIRADWIRYCKQNGLPQNYTKFRFGGGYQNFLEALKDRLDKKNIPYSLDKFKLTKEERYTKEINQKISRTLKGKNAENNKKKK